MWMGTPNRVWFSKLATANIVGCCNITKDFPVTFDSVAAQTIIVHRESVNGKPNMHFQFHPSGMYYYDPKAPLSLGGGS